MRVSAVVINLCFVFSGLFVPVLADAQERRDSGNVPAEPSYRVLAAHLSRFIETEIKQKDIPAFSIALVDNDRVVWAQGFGFADEGRKSPASAETVYRVGSVSKLLNDDAVVQMVEQGKLRLDEDVRKIIPEFKPENPFGKPVTLRQLMNHTSGLVRESPRGNYFDPTEPTLKETVLSLNQTRLLHRPNSKTKYSNAAVSVAGYMMEKITGEPFAKHLETALLQPLGMSSSSYVLNPSIEKKLADAWMWSYDGRRFRAPTFALGTLPAGNLYSSVLDLAEFMKVIFAEGRKGDQQVISKKLMREMLTPQTGRDGQKRSYGIGFRIGKLGEHTTFEHGGAVYGFATQFRGLPDRKLGVITVASLDVANGFVSRVADQALRGMLEIKNGKAVKPIVSTEPVGKDFARKHAGLYKNKKETLRIWESQGRMMLRSGTYENEIRKWGDQYIVDDVQAFSTLFEFSENRIRVNGGQEWKRIKDARPQDAPDRWKGLIGEYGWDHNTMFIYERDGKLWTLIEWVFHYPLKEIDDNVFAFPDYGLYHGEKLFFERVDQGQASHVRAAEVLFKRRKLTGDGKTFRIRPLLSEARLRELAFAAEPPNENRDFLKSDLVELTSLDPTMKRDIRYATTNNFMGMVFYKEPKAFLQRPAAKALLKAHQELEKSGMGFLIHDAYRPWFVTKMFWDATPQEMKHFVADPDKGSRHNRGCAVDLTLYDRKTGKVIPMVAGYDEFSERAYPNYPGGTSLQRWYRRKLRDVMEKHGFEIYEYEWWHFDFAGWENYPIGNRPFSKIETAEQKKRP